MKRKNEADQKVQCEMKSSLKHSIKMSFFTKVIRRESLSENFSVPPGWTRISISDKSDPVLEFYVDTIFEER